MSALPMVIDETNALVRLEAARRMLAGAKSLDDVKEIRDQAEAIRVYRKAAGHGLEMQNDAAEIKLRAERRIGELLAETLERGGDRRSTSHDVRSKPRLKDLDIEPMQSSRYQQMARVPEPEFERHIIETKAEQRELTSASVLEVAKGLQRQQRTETRDANEQARDAEPLDSLPMRLEVADATDLPLADGTVDLFVTSPPYGLDVPYLGIRDEANGWRDFMTDWLVEAFRVAKPDGRLALNVPLDTTKPRARATYMQAVAAALEAGWDYRWTIVWNEGNVNKSIARGSVDSASAPHVITPVEMIAVFCKAEWGRASYGVSDITHAEWLEWTNGLWTFPGESRAWRGHPAPFPPELPRRLIKLLSFRGDTVCDPFLGSGTTALVAHQLGREVIGFDITEKYVADSRRRLAEAIHATA